MIQRLNNDPGHDPTLNNDSGRDSDDNFPNETIIMNNISRFRENLPIWRNSPILRIFPSIYISKAVRSYGLDIDFCNMSTVTFIMEI